MTLNISKLEIFSISVLDNFLIATDTNRNERKYDISDMTKIKAWNLSGNQLTSLPALPPKGLKYLHCFLNQLTSLPELPEGLEILNCFGNRLVELPKLPESLATLSCSRNPLTILPNLPENLTTLSCSENQLTSLPALPKGLKILNCDGNQLAELPSLPEGLKTLYCYENQLTSLPRLPESLRCLNLSGNQLKYVQFLKERPWHCEVPLGLRDKHSEGVYQRNYVLQTLSRYLAYFFSSRSKYYKTFRIFDIILLELLV